jgi:hypothetical protein
MLVLYAQEGFTHHTKIGDHPLPEATPPVQKKQ